MADEIERLEARVRALEAAQAGLMARLAALEGTPIPVAPPPILVTLPAPAPEPVTVADEVAEAPPAPAPVPAPAGPPAATDWERLIGGRWAMWVGALALFLAVASFLAYTWAAIPAAVRVTGGFGLGGALMAAGFVVRKRAEPWFGEGLAGAGLALLYLNVWSAHTHHMLVGTVPTFAGLLAVTAVGAWLAVRHHVTSLIALSTAGGFLAPMVLGGDGEGLQRAGYALVLDGGLLAISLYRRWPALVWGCLVGTLAIWPYTGLSAGWSLLAMTAAFGLFLGAAVGHGLRTGKTTPAADVMLLFPIAFFYAMGAFDPASTYLPGREGLFPAGLALLFAVLGQLGRRRVPADAAFVQGLDSLAIFFLTAALPVQFRQATFVTAWAVEAALLAGLWYAFKNPVARWLSPLVGGVAAIGAGVLAVVEAPGRLLPVVNDRALPLAVGTLAACGTIAFARRHGQPPGFAALLALVGGGTAWLAVDAGILTEAWAWLPGDAAPRLAAGGMAIAALATYSAGARLREPLLRLAGLLWWGLALSGVVLVDPLAEAASTADGRPIATLVAAACAVAMALQAARLPADEARAEGEPALTGLLGLATVLLLVWGASAEAYAGLRSLAWPGWERQGQLAISMVWIGAGVLSLLGGIRARQRAFRLLGLGLLGASVCKVFVADLAFLDTPYRIAAFGGLGVALMGISWLYGRYGTGEAQQPQENQEIIEIPKP